MDLDHEETRRQFENRLAAEGLDIMDYAHEEKARREENPEETDIVATSKGFETQIIETLVTRERLGEDVLTGAKNLRKYQEETARLQNEAKIARKRIMARRKIDTLADEPFAVIAFDIDHFKQINDTHGHAAGDEVLQEMVRRVQDILRHGDVLARCGGEEFRIIALAVNGNAARLAERIRRVVAGKPFLVHANSGNVHTIKVTISLGVSSYDAETHNMELRSDTALYGAKGNDRPLQKQRNQVWVWNKAKGKALPYSQSSVPVPLSDSAPLGSESSGSSASDFS